MQPFSDSFVRRAFVLDHGIVGESAKGDLVSRHTHENSLPLSAPSEQYVSCPLHKRNFTLVQGDCLNDPDFSILTFNAREAPDGGIQLQLPPVEELDAVIGTEKWMVRQAQSEVLGLAPASQAEIAPPNVGINEAECGGGCSGSNKLDW